MSLKRKLQRAIDRSEGGAEILDWAGQFAAVSWCMVHALDEVAEMEAPLDIKEQQGALLCKNKMLAQFNLEKSDIQSLYSSAADYYCEVGKMDNGAVNQLYMEGAWYESAMPTIDLEPELAASLLATDAGALLNDLRMPFPSVLVRVPEGLLPKATTVMFSNIIEMWQILVKTEEQSVFSQTHDLGNFNRHGNFTQRSDTDPISAGRDLSDPEQRVFFLAQKLAINAVVMMTQGGATAVPNAPAGGQYKRRRPGVPERRFYRLTAPVVHDMRPAIRDYIVNGGKSPTVQCVVAGHWKMQRCGPGGSERKRIFIEPYWRGPEEAPIAIRPHILKPEPP